MEHNKNTSELKEYLKMVFELESAIYRNNQMKTEYIADRETHQPCCPQKEVASAPTQPIQFSKQNPAKNVLSESEKRIEAWLYAICIISGICSFWMVGMFFAVIVPSFFDYGPFRFPFGFVFFMIAFICCMIFCIKRIKKYSQKKEEAYARLNDKNEKQYQEQLSEYNKEVLRLEEVYKEVHQKYVAEKGTYQEETLIQEARFTDSCELMEKQLSTLYSQDIIYPKYRNLVAMATIYEYFASGRCFELEGPSGAYNLYESELRANIIITSLNQITSDLDQIKNGQYALYEMINASNQTIVEMLGNVSKAQYLTAYFAKEAALAASADRYIVGRVYSW